MQASNGISSLLSRSHTLSNSNGGCFTKPSREYRNPYGVGVDVENGAESSPGLGGTARNKLFAKAEASLLIRLGMTWV